jgi:hypothetical protein
MLRYAAVEDPKCFFSLPPHLHRKVPSGSAVLALEPFDDHSHRVTLNILFSASAFPCSLIA